MAPSDGGKALLSPAVQNTTRSTSLWTQDRYVTDAFLTFVNSITPPPTRTYRVQIIQRTVESSDTRLQQALLWIAHECRISRVDPKLSLIHSYSSLEYLEVFFFALNTSRLGLVYRRLLFVNSRTARGHLRLLLSKLSWSINITHALPQHSQWLLHKQSALLHIAYMLPK